jgi:uncharacterized protein YhbP (UPF0306 family)
METTPTALTKHLVLAFLKEHKLMTIATYGDFPWIANVYYTSDDEMNLYFMSNPATLHCKQIAQNEKVAVAIADSHQDINKFKRGLQLSGTAHELSEAAKVQHVLKMWKMSLLEVDAPELSYHNMLAKVVTGRMFQVAPKRIKLFDQHLFKTKDGEEPILEL